MVQTSLPFESNVSEFEEVGIKLLESETIAAPRPADASVCMECELVHTHDMGTTHLFVGEVKRYHLCDSVVHLDGKGHRVVKLSALDPVGRLGGYDYCRVTDVFESKAQK